MAPAAIRRYKGRVIPTRGVTRAVKADEEAFDKLRKLRTAVQSVLESTPGVCPQHAACAYRKVIALYRAMLQEASRTGAHFAACNCGLAIAAYKAKLDALDSTEFGLPIGDKWVAMDGDLGPDDE